jgi:hypothetical protein
MAAALVLLTAVPILANRKIARSFREEEVFAPTAFARFVTRRDPEGRFRTLDETLYRVPSPLAIAQFGAALSDAEFNRRSWYDHGPLLFGRGTVFNEDFDAGDLSRVESLRRVSGMASGFRDSDALFGSVALKFGIRYRDQEPVAGFEPVGGDALQAWDEAPRAYPDIRLVESWLEVPTPLAALDALRGIGPGEIVVESGASRRGAARPGTARVLHRSAERLEVEVDSPDGGWLFVLRAFWPYREILVDGRPVEAAPAQLAFCAVPIPPGRHRVEWRELVPGFAAARWGPVLFAFLVAGVAVAGRRGRRR